MNWLRSSFKSVTNPLYFKLCNRKSITDLNLEDILMKRLDEKSDSTLDKKKKNVNKILSS